jgi:hypothetical protein
VTKSELNQAAFWHQPVCLSCGEVGEEDQGTIECESCGEYTCIPARVILNFIAAHLLEGEGGANGE